MVTNHKDVSQIECNLCGQKFWCKANLKRHIKDHSTIIGVVGSNQPYACRVCHKTFNTTRTLRNHKKVHTRGNVYTCDICGKSFPYMHYLTQHRQTHSEGSRKFPCHLCKCSFWQAAKLKNHILTHKKEKNVLCSQCGKAFIHKYAMMAHFRYEHVGKKSTFSCLICKKNFSKPAHVKRHMLIHQGLKQHECHLCGKSCVQLSNLHTHQRLVHKLLPFKCESCDQTFRYKEELKDHCVEFHPPINC